MTTSKGTIQGYNGIAISDSQNQIILQANTCGSVGEQQTLKPAVEQLKETFKELGTEDTFKQAKFTADSGFHSKINLEYLDTTGLDCYLADTGFRSRNPLFSESKTYQDEKEKAHKKRHKRNGKYFSVSDFSFNKEQMSCTCPTGNPMWCSSQQTKVNGKLYYRFEGYLNDCKTCPKQKKCMQKAVSSHGRQVIIAHDKSSQASNVIDKMKAKIDSVSGRREYSQRLGTIEPVFGNITVNKGMNRFTLRGQEKVNAQWQLFCLVHNIEELRNSLH